MGLGPLSFGGMWTLMMTAMMLPAATHAVTSWRSLPPKPGVATGEPVSSQLLLFGAGYLLVWAATGLPAYGAAVGAGRLAAHHPSVATTAGAAALVVAGTYQFSRTKSWSLEHCRQQRHQPGPGVHRSGLGAGLEHGVWCIACSWAVIALMITFGVMNVAAMVALGVAAYAERFFPGPAFRRVTGLVALALAVAVAFSPSLAAGLHRASMGGMGHM
jgi:predicted metal-binding membrane protein